MIRKDSFEQISNALEILELPTFISSKELKDRYKLLAGKNHPDMGGDVSKMAKINSAYTLLRNYMDNFKFSFSKDEVYKQFPQDDYASRFRF